VLVEDSVPGIKGSKFLKFAPAENAALSLRLGLRFYGSLRDLKKCSSSVLAIKSFENLNIWN
jgi:hypothetical protein